MSSVVWLSVFFFFKQKTAYEMRISDWSSDVCSSDLWPRAGPFRVKVADKRGRERIASVHTEAADDGDGRFLATPEAAQARAVGAGLCGGRVRTLAGRGYRSEEHTSELQSLMRSSYAVFCLKKKKKNNRDNTRM